MRFLEIVLRTAADIVTVPDPISKLTFGAVHKLKNTKTIFFIFDLKPTDVHLEVPNLF